ncbi:MAG: sulfatase-like hydrolase/transferase [Phycisphaera sp.]|nr:sulfatase-like hydrolase/transferase [Phycisphaera sp.]
MRFHPRRFIAVAVLVLTACLSFARLAAAAEAPPNIIMIFTDDQGYQDLGSFGSPLIKTPNLDKMAAEGMRFTDFYVAAPVCSASRAGLMTGCFCQRVGITGVLFPRDKVGLNPEEVTIPEVLKQKGYATIAIGKWHLGHHPEFLPTRQGFDSYLGIPYSNDMGVDPTANVADDAVFREGKTLEDLRKSNGRGGGPPLMRNEQIIEWPADLSTLTQRYTAEAIRFIKEHKDGPFFVYLPHTMPHVPLAASEAFRGKSKRGLYGDAIEEIDWSSGQIIKTLRDLGIDKNTLIVYTSDNGPWLKKGKDGGSALPLRDGKFTTWEGGMREPTIMWWPGHIPAGKVCSEIASSIDMLPTFAHLANAPIPSDRVIDGKDIRPLMFGEPGAKTPHDFYPFYKGNNLQAIRSGKWKLRPSKNPKNVELYNLEDDISETSNVASGNPDVVERLSKAAEEFDAELQKTKRPVGKLN